MTPTPAPEDVACTRFDGPAGRPGDFEASRDWFIRCGGALPEPMLLDAWIATSWPPAGLPNRGKCVHHRFRSTSGSGDRFHRWLKEWAEATRKRAERGGDVRSLRFRFAPAFDLMRRLKVGADESFGVLHASIARFYRAFEDLPTGTSVLADVEVVRAIEFVAADDQSEPGFMADREAIYAFAQWAGRRGRLGANPPLSAPLPGGTAFRVVRAETGPFLERAPGFLPANPARLAPTELGYLRIDPLKRLFAYRAANGALWRSFGSRSTPENRKPRVHVELLVQEVPAWHVERPGSPRGLISTARAAAAYCVAEVLRALASGAFETTLFCEWRGIAGGAPWTTTVVVSAEACARFRVDPRASAAFVFDRLPVCFATAHRVSGPGDSPAADPAADIILRFHVGPAARRPPTAADVRAASLVPVAPLRIFASEADAAVVEVAPGSGGHPAPAAVEQIVDRMLAVAVPVEREGPEIEES